MGLRWTQWDDRRRGGTFGTQGVCVCVGGCVGVGGCVTGTRMGSLLVDVIGDSQVTMERCWYRHLWSPGSVNPCIWRPG